MLVKDKSSAQISLTSAVAKACTKMSISYPERVLLVEQKALLELLYCK